MEKSGFFNAMKVGDSWDRIYKAENFAEYFATFIGNGIFPNPASQLQVVQTDKMQIIIRQGKAWINGFIYINTDDLILDIDVADGVLNRIDRIVLTYDVSKREIRAKIKKGQFKSEAIAPEIQRNADIYELALADIKISAGVIKITQADIKDLRFNKELCGLVHATVDQIDSTVIFNQFQSWYSNKQSEFDKNIDTWTDKKKKEFETWITQNTQSFLDKLNNFYDTNNKEFEKWFNALKEKLKGDVATNLLNEVSATKEEVKDNKKEIDNLKVSIENTDKKIDKIELTAERVTIKDSDNLFSSNDVEGALKEVFINADKGKKFIAKIVGEPLKDTNTHLEMGNKINTMKLKLVSLLNEKKVKCEYGPLETLINRVKDIQTGVKFATGVIPCNNAYMIEFKGLAFKPYLIILNSYELSFFAMLSSEGIFKTRESSCSFEPSNVLDAHIITIVCNTNVSSVKLSGFNIHNEVFDNGFKLQTNSGMYTKDYNYNVKFWAFGKDE